MVSLTEDDQEIKNILQSDAKPAKYDHPMTILTKQQYFSTISKLISAGASVDVQDSKGRSIIDLIVDIAYQKNDITIIENFVENGYSFLNQEINKKRRKMKR